MVEKTFKMIPSGITSLDGIIGGGFPAGSLILSAGEIGSGYREFVVTSSVMLTAIKHGQLGHPAGKNLMIPEEIWWATFTKPKAALLNEFAMSLDSDLFEPLHKHVKFQDFSREYFENSSVPSEWISEKTPRRGGKKSVKPKKFDNLLNSLADFLSAHAEKNVVILHTMTDLAGLYSSVPEKWHEFTLFLKGIQRASKKWGGLIYTDLATQVLPKRMEEEIAAIADGVLSFQWEQAGPVERRRTFHFRKFSGLLESHQEALTKFEVNISSSTGLFVVKPEAIEAIHR